ncbi:MAG: 2-amino-3,7-dideoxy-D-threo-hept-6-ulosonate synthase [Candidatus Diapherotrites archaeon]|nr:2-amino-3,7-dideoxy-D-threo-hept-6-ulosonate synthase [Candidatus Diapherotrites archaeon]
MLGKQIRLKRITKKGKAVIIPMDHGTTEGPIPGLENMEKMVKKIEKGKATAILVHKGILQNLNHVPNCGVILHLSASTKLGQDPEHKVLVASVQEAIHLGADAVSIHVNIGGNIHENSMLESLGKISKDCLENQIPLLAMMYPRGKNIAKIDPETISHIARIGGELGADLVKTVYTGNEKSFKKIVDSCPVPIVIAGGPKCSTDQEVLEMVKGAMNAGAIGVSLGRNAFQHKNPVAMVRAIREIVVKNAEVKDALELM